MKIAVVGATATGKTRLARDLTLHLPELQVSDAPCLDLLQAEAYEHVLLMGLDLPCIAPAQHQADAALRAQLAALGINYGVVYGSGPRRLQHALRLVSPQDAPPVRWHGVCEKCADPECEFRLFTALQSSKAAARPVA
jgi:hypothetical protein